MTQALPGAGAQSTQPQSLGVAAGSKRPLALRAFWRSLPWTATAVVVYITQIVTSILMGGEWLTSLVVLQVVVVAVFVAIFYALALAKERENEEGPI